MSGRDLGFCLCALLVVVVGWLLRPATRIVTPGQARRTGDL